MVVQGGRAEVELGGVESVEGTFVVFKCEDMTMRPHHRKVTTKFITISTRVATGHPESTVKERELDKRPPERKSPRSDGHSLWIRHS